LPHFNTSPASNAPCRSTSGNDAQASSHWIVVASFGHRKPNTIPQQPSNAPNARTKAGHGKRVVPKPMTRVKAALVELLNR
jgi:hypothetical protein